MRFLQLSTLVVLSLDFVLAGCRSGVAGTEGTGAMGGSSTGAAGSAGQGGAIETGGSSSGGAAGPGGTGGAGTGGAGGSGGIGTGGTGGISTGGTGGSGGAGGSGGVGVDSTPVSFTPGIATKILLRGTVVTGVSDPFEGEVLVEDDKFSCVAEGTGCTAQAAGATVIETHGTIAPGLVDTHNHILFDIFDNDDWNPLPVYMNVEEWNGSSNANYAAVLDVKQCFAYETGKPVWCPDKYASANQGNLLCEMDKFGELKAILSGTTSVIGFFNTSRTCYGSLARTLGGGHNDLLRNGQSVDNMRTSAAWPVTASSANGACGAFPTDVYLVHAGEGIDMDATDQFNKLKSVSTPEGCVLAPQTTVVHGTGFTQSQFDEMSAANVNLTWSPRSNVSLYGDTTDIPAALGAGINVSVGPDWSMGGSQNMLDELRFADVWDDTHWNNSLSAEMLVKMATVHPAKAIAYDDLIGSIQVGLYADLFVVDADPMLPYESVVSATPSAVRLTMVGGKILYGDAVLKPAGSNAAQCEDLPVCGRDKFVCVAEVGGAASDKLSETLAEVTAVLNDAMLEADALSGGTYPVYPLPPLYRCPEQ